MLLRGLLQASQHMHARRADNVSAGGPLGRGYLAQPPRALRWQSCVLAVLTERDWDELHDELWPLIDDILEQTAKTLADLGVQAQAMAVERHDLWTSERGADEYRLRFFVERVCRLSASNLCRASW
jgi:hypothetical protein